MYLKHKIYASLFTLFVFFTVYYLEARLNEVIVSSLINAFSIIFGFYMTSISVLYGSEYIKKLYKREDTNRDGFTELHTLRNYFSASCYCSLLSILSLLIFLLVAHETPEKFLVWNEAIFTLNGYNVNITSVNFWSSFILSLSGINFCFLVLLLNVFLKGLVEEAKSAS